MPDKPKPDHRSPGETEREQRLVPLKWLAKPSLEEFSEAARRFSEAARPRRRDAKLLKLFDVRAAYRWPWGAGAEYLYRELIHALGLRDQEYELMRLAKSKPGRKEERELARRIWTLKAEGKTVPQIKAGFEAEGQYFSKEKIESYLKTRRRKRKPQDMS